MDAGDKHLPGGRSRALRSSITTMDDLTRFLRPAGRRHLHRQHGARGAGGAAAAALRRARRRRGAAKMAGRAGGRRRRRARRSSASRPTRGAGLVRGAAFGPEGVRRALLAACPDFAARAARAGIVDVGDVFAVPQLLEDDMLSEEQRRRTRAALYGPAAAGRREPAGGAAVDRRARRSASCWRATRACGIFMLGGDHSVAWPVVAALARHVSRAVGDRARRRAHGSAAGAAGRAPLLRDLGVPRERAARAGRPAGAGRRARVVAIEAALGVDAGRAPVLGGRGARARRWR